jgi:predicted dinucleotide-binding enzyme
MKIGVLGTGRVGKSVGHGLQKAGHVIAFGSRSPEDNSDLGAPVLGLAEAVMDVDVVVSAIPGSVALETLRTIGAHALGGKVLMDIGNALTDQFELLFPNSSLGAAIQDAFPGTAVVKTLNTVTAPLMADPARSVRLTSSSPETTPPPRPPSQRCLVTSAGHPSRR